jgi:polycystin 1L2
VPYCTNDYSIFNFEDKNYTLGWQTYTNQSVYENIPDLEFIYLAFKYQSAWRSSSYPYSGIYTTYLGGGYMFQFMNANVSQLQSNFTALQHSGWIDRYTRAVLVEMSLFNPNIQLFGYVTLLFEILPTGNWIVTMRVDPLNLSDVTQSVSSLKTIANIIYLGFVVFFIVREMNKFRLSRPKIEYLKNFWNWVELAIIACSWASFAMYLYRMYAVDDMLKKLKKYSHNSIIRLQSIQVIIYELFKFNHQIGSILYNFY